MGGRPSRPIQYDPVLPTEDEPGRWVWADGVDDYCSSEEDEETRKKRWVREYWQDEGGHFNGELIEWQQFRKFQRRLRSKKPEDILRRQQIIDDYWRKRGIKEELKPQVQIQPEMRTKLDEWKEFYYHQHMWHEVWEQQIKSEDERTERYLKAFDDAQPIKGTTRRRVWGDHVDQQDIMDIRLRSVLCYEEGLKLLNERLDWIEQQIPVIALECGLSNRVSKATTVPR